MKKLPLLLVLALAAVASLPAPARSQSATTGATVHTSVLPNDGSTGTTINKLAKLNSSGNAVITATTDTDGAVGVVLSNAGTTGKAQIALGGTVKCAFDGTATPGHFVQISPSVAGDCRDTGAATRPATGQVVGVVASGGVGAGTYSVALGVPAGTTAPPISSVTGLGTGVATALGINIGSAGAVVTNGGALGSPSSAGTMPAFTLGGTVTGGGQTLSNIGLLLIGSTSQMFNETLHLVGATTSAADSIPLFVEATATNGPVDFVLYNNAATSTSNQTQFILQAQDSVGRATAFTFQTFFSTTANATRTATTNFNVSYLGATVTALSMVGPNAVFQASIGTKTPTTLTGTSGSVGNTDAAVIVNASGTFTLTLPTASNFTGRLLSLKSIAAQTVNSASSNVVPLAGGAAGTALLTNTAGKWATLQSDGSNWNIMASN